MKVRVPWIIDHLDEHFDRTLETAGYTGRCLACSHVQDEDGGQTANDRPEKGVQIPHVDVKNRRLVSGGKVLQVVRDVLGRIHCARAFASCHIVKATQIVENRLRPPRRNALLRERAGCGSCHIRTLSPAPRAGF
jgi:hypothetical protein